MTVHRLVRNALRRLAAASLLGTLAACGSTATRPEPSIVVQATVTKACHGCEIMDVVGSDLVFDIVSLRVDSPEAYAGKLLKVSVLVEQRDQREWTYPVGAVVEMAVNRRFLAPDDTTTISGWMRRLDRPRDRQRKAGRDFPTH